VRGGMRSGYWKETRAFFVGLLPTLLVLFVFKIHLAPANDILAGQAPQATLVRLSDGNRYWQVAKTFVLFGYMIGPGAPLLLAAYGALLGWRPRGTGDWGAFFPALLLTFILAGYFFVYIITPRNVIEHMSNSLDRLLLQLWPLCLFVFFLVIATPAEAWAKSRLAAK